MPKVKKIARGRVRVLIPAVCCKSSFLNHSFAQFLEITTTQLVKHHDREEQGEYTESERTSRMSVHLVSVCPGEKGGECHFRATGSTT